LVFSRFARDSDTHDPSSRQKQRAICPIFIGVK
jgi:hypothetical protein